MIILTPTHSNAVSRSVVHNEVHCGPWGELVAVELTHSAPAAPLRFYFYFLTREKAPHPVVPRRPLGFAAPAFLDLFFFARCQVPPTREAR